MTIVSQKLQTLNFKNDLTLQCKIILYFKLLTEESPRVAVSVALIIPILGVMFGWIFLDEKLTITKILGSIAILVSVKFVLNISLKDFYKKRQKIYE